MSLNSEPQSPHSFSSHLPLAHQTLCFHLQRAHRSIKTLAHNLHRRQTLTRDSPRNSDVHFISSSIAIPKHHPLPPFPSSLPFAHQNLSFHLQRAKESIANLFGLGPGPGAGPVLCTASLAVAARKREDDEERVLISEVLIRNKDGEALERKDLEEVAASAIRACRPNSALTVNEVQEDVHRIVESGLFSSCMPVAVDTRDGIRLVFQV